MRSSFRAHCVPPRARSSAQLLVGVPAEGTAAAPPPWLPLPVRAVPLRDPPFATVRPPFRAHSPAQPRVGVPAEGTAAAPPPWLPLPVRAVPLRHPTCATM